jgi:predicted nucleic acid-binding Zn ribbon protein
MSAPQKISDVLARLITQRGYARMQGATVEREVWAEAVGPQIASMSRPGELKRGVLDVYVTSNILIQELGFQKAQLLAALQAKLPQHKITGLRFKVGSIS